MQFTKDELGHLPDEAPSKVISSSQDMNNWASSSGKRIICEFLQLLNGAARNGVDSVKLDDVGYALVQLLDTLRAEIDNIPLHTGPNRFGNTAFRVWIEYMEKVADTQLVSVLGEKLVLKQEALHYFKNAFGSGQRVDFGTGHELSFLLFALVLYRVGILSNDNLASFVHVVFRAYVKVAEKLQTKFTLEPAGSKGVWGLDDHFHLLYYFGAAELMNQSEIEPKSILDTSLTARLAPRFLFFEGVNHVRVLKKGPFHEHSPVLYTIASQVPSWAKVNSGLWKMYHDEVLSKFAVTQHIYFGQAIPWV